MSEDAKTFASSLTAPYCGVNCRLRGRELAGRSGARRMSLALIPLRVGRWRPQAFGLLVLASPDPQRFNSGMGTDFLERIAELAGAALSPAALTRASDGRAS